MIIAIPTSNEKTICEHIPFCKHFLIINTDTKEKKLIENPMFEIVKNKKIKKECGENALHTGEIIPKYLKSFNIEMLIAKNLGEGMIDNLEFFGIIYKLTDLDKIEDIITRLLI